VPAIAIAILMLSITAKHCNTADRAIPCAYALLEHKRQET